MPGKIGSENRIPQHTETLESPLPKQVKHPHLHKILDFLFHNAFFKKISEGIHNLRHRHPAVASKVTADPSPVQAHTTEKVVKAADTRIKTKSGAVYDGKVNESNRPHGSGIFLSSEKDMYKGNFLNGKFHGKGYMEKANGDRFAGTFENGQFVSGYAIIKDQNGKETKYIVENGEWTNS